MPVIDDFKYVPSPTGYRFHESDAFLKLVAGPYGSGKTCMIMNDAKYYCLAQTPASDGVRYTRIGVVRGTYPELISTTRNSILEVFPKQFGTIRNGGAPIFGHYRFPVGDGPYDYLQKGEPWKKGYGTIADVELALQALQTAQDAEKIKSANWTFAIINEATSVDFEIITAIMGRVGRYPTMELGGCSWAGLLIDTNQPPQGHYLLNMMAHPEDNWEIFHQPPAAFKHVDSNGAVSYELNTEAENLRNLGAKAIPDDFDTWSKDKQEQYLKDKGVDYYRNQIQTFLKEGRQDKIDSLFCMLDVPMKDGKPVFPMFNMDTHVATEDIQPEPYKPVIIGYDTSGIHPACVFIQEIQGKWTVLDELYGDGMGMQSFIETALVPLCASRYCNCELVVSCDPANAKDSYTGLSPSQHLEEHGFRVNMPRTNDPKTRINAVDSLLNKVQGGFLIAPNCRLLISAMQGGYRYKKLRLVGSIEDAYDPKPEKNTYSHVADALQYACMYIVRDGDNATQSAEQVIKAISQRRKTLGRIM
jgi:hypothetical protein